MSVLVTRPKQLLLSLGRKRVDLAIPLASYITSVTLVVWGAYYARMWHWFVIPVFICGLLIGPDAIRWLRGEYDLFDPKGIVGMYGWYFFFLAPLLFISWDVGMLYVINPLDWRPWVGILATLNIASLILYQLFQSLGFHWCVSNKRVKWIINPEHTLPLFIAFGSIALLAQIYYLSQGGGFINFISTTTAVRQSGQSGLRTLGNSLPMIVFIYLTLIKTKLHLKKSSFFTIAVIIFILSIVQFLLGGEGSRSTTVWSLFWIAGIIHYFWRPISRRTVVIALILLIMFMYTFALFVKSNHRAEAWELLVRGASFSEIEAAAGLVVGRMIIGDLSRVDIQSYQVYRLENSADYDLRWGKTYIIGLIHRFIPGWIWPARPVDTEKIVAGTELLWGQGAYKPGVRGGKIFRPYGLAGEAMLNFGPFLAPLPFAIWGFLMGRYRYMVLNWDKMDARRLLVPFVTLLFLVALIGDLDNLVAIFISKGSVITLLFLLSSRWST